MGEFMGLYDSSPGVNLSIDFGKIKFLLIAIAVILVLAFVFIFINSLIQPKALSFALDKTQIKFGGNDFATLKVKVANVTGQEASNVLVEVNAKSGVLIDSQSTAVKTIKLIGINETREIEFALRANPDEKILPGDYTVNVKTSINEIEFEESFSIKIVK